MKKCLLILIVFTACNIIEFQNIPLTVKTYKYKINEMNGYNFYEVKPGYWVKKNRYYRLAILKKGCVPCVTSYAYSYEIKDDMIDLHIYDIIDALKLLHGLKNFLKENFSTIVVAYNIRDFVNHHIIIDPTDVKMLTKYKCKKFFSKYNNAVYLCEETIDISKIYDGYKYV
jgi:hypothetical protein